MNNLKLNKEDYCGSVPKCIQYANMVDKGDFSNPFYLDFTLGEVVGPVYYIIGGRWELRIISYDPDTGILTGQPRLCLNDESMKFKAIPVEEGIKHRYIGVMAGDDASNLRELESLRNKQLVSEFR